MNQVVVLTPQFEKKTDELLYSGNVSWNRSGNTLFKIRSWEEFEGVIRSELRVDYILHHRGYTPGGRRYRANHQDLFHQVRLAYTKSWLLILCIVPTRAQDSVGSTLELGHEYPRIRAEKWSTLKEQRIQSACQNFPLYPWSWVRVYQDTIRE